MLLTRMTALIALAVFAFVFGAASAPIDDRAATTFVPRLSAPERLAPVHRAGALEQRNAELLASTESPSRDLISLTRRLKLGGSGDIPSVVNQTQPNYPVGTRHRFSLADIVKKGYSSIDATVKVVTPHAYWYVKDGYSIDLGLLRGSAAHFESRIYPETTRVFGSEVLPGIDNDPRITILLAPMNGVGGYFSSADTYPKIVNPFSNERDMIYLAIRPQDAPGSPGNYFESTLAHELQHMIHWNMHPNRDVWLDEGCSEVASFLNGYENGGTDYLFTTTPDTQLNGWAEPPKNGAHYGASYLFLRYLMDRYGGESFITGLLKHNEMDVHAIDAAVLSAGDPSGFEGAFQSWTVANVLNDRNLDGGRYAYSEGGRVKPRSVVRAYPATRSDTVSQYAADYISLTGASGPLRVSFKGNSTVRAIAAAPHSGRYFWYSNRRDSGDATLTREFDLSAVKSATLKFWVWHDIEQAFDYAYVQASTDGGRSWSILPGRGTTTDNPNGASFGPAFTGKSGVAAASKAAARWVEERVDLSAYAGKRVLLRFEYVTDEGYNKPGLALDDLQIPEIGYQDNAETEGGWQAAGFVHMGTDLPQRWYVAVVEKGKTNKVRVLTVDANGAGSIDLAGIGKNTAMREAVLVIAPMAPKTTEVANYTVTIRRR